MQSIEDEASPILYGVDQLEGCLPKLLQAEGEFT